MQKLSINIVPGDKHHRNQLAKDGIQTYIQLSALRALTFSTAAGRGNLIRM
jgi:hypothetical protein